MLIPTFFTVLFLSIMLVFTLKWCLNHFHRFELFLLFLFTSSICQFTYFKLFSPYDRLSASKGWWAVLSIKLHYGLILPILLIWILYVYVSKTTELKKLISIFTWITFVVVAEKIYLLLGVFQSKSNSWYPSIDMFFGMVIISISIFFLEELKNILRKEKILS
ncbi:hypothetical protein FIU87_13055 [Bacillus sp. THAF10]|uniref:hypothetical protein n=1 Tax=Bacillus sp. THAF10 TaxID=2587848 RepID=UPI0012A96232|nr:hypothetical protein [Bacillus sp. THAF10]QFT89582.1 hypothetical protein FIU87_13055 [Bacillus sp. THAF10]